MRVLALTNGWPTERFPEYCVFNRRQVDEIRSLGVAVDVEFINAREGGKLQYLSCIAQIARRAHNYDLVHCFHGLSFLAARAGRVRRPLVVSFLNALNNEFVDLPSPVRTRVTGLAKRMIASPRAPYGVIFKDCVPAELAGRFRVRCIPNGVDMIFFQPADKRQARRMLGLDPEPVYLVFVSSKNLYRPQKRYDRFKQVLEAYRAARPDLDIREITLVSEPEDIVRATYRAADVHVLTSDFEGSPNSVKEALSCQLPVVSTNVGNVAAMCAGLEGACVLPSFSIDDFVAAVDRVRNVGDEARAELRESLRARGLDARSSARRVVELYDAVLHPA